MDDDVLDEEGLGDSPGVLLGAAKSAPKYSSLIQRAIAILNTPEKPLDSLTPVPARGTSQENLFDVLRPYYAGIPGGVAAVQQEAKTAQRDPVQEIPGYRERWSPLRSFDRPVAVKWGQTLPPGRTAKYGILSDTISIGNQVTPQGTATPESEQSLRHELTHAAQKAGSLSSDMPFLSEAPSFLRDYNQRDVGEYLKGSTTPIEMDTNLADMKRFFSHATGQPVNSMKAANEAWEWNRRHRGNNLDVRILDILPPDKKQEAKRRLLDLIQSSRPQVTVPS